MNNTLHIEFEGEIAQGDELIFFLRTSEALAQPLQGIEGCLYHMKRTNFKGNKGEVIEFTTNGSHHCHKLILIGIGEGSLTPLEWQELGGELAIRLQGKKVFVWGSGDDSADVAFGLLLRDWRFLKYKTAAYPDIRTVTFIVDKPEVSRSRFAVKEHLYQGVSLCRNLTVEPANHLYPEAFAQRCLNLCAEGLEVQVIDDRELEAIGAQSILSVGKSSVHPPRMVVLKWTGSPSSNETIALVGKGVCYDSGGINIKTKELLEMKFDKAGAAAVVGTLLTLARQKVPLNVVGVVGLAENMIDGASMRPGDIIATLSGKTVEIVDTDYEGRLILADCLWYAQQMFNPHVIIDLGTLTPETIAPLADEYAGLYCEDACLTAELFQAGLQSGEKAWHLPMGMSYAKQIHSEFADIKNMGIPGFGEGAAAAEFLKCFIKPGVRWAHLDIAGVAWTLEDTFANRKGITGFGVRLLTEWLKCTII